MIRQVQTIFWSVMCGTALVAHLLSDQPPMPWATIAMFSALALVVLVNGAKRMTKKIKPVKKTRAQLEREVMELKAQLASTYHFATATLHKAGDQLMASGALLRLEALGGRELIPPVLIRDGLSKETIAAIHADLVRSYELATMFKPVALK